MHRNRQNHQRQRPQRNERAEQQRAEPKSLSAVLMQFLPILLIIIFSMSSSIFKSKKLYSLDKRDTMVHEQKSFRIGVKFYTDKSYFNLASDEKYRLNIDVENEYLSNIQSKCSSEQRYQALQEHGISSKGPLQRSSLSGILFCSKKNRRPLTFHSKLKLEFLSMNCFAFQRTYSIERIRNFS